VNLQTFIRRPVFTAVLAVTLVVFGLYAMPRIGVALLPEIEFPVVTVTTVYPGADPETMERDVSEILEEPLSTISGLDTIKSINVEGVSQVVLVFDLEKSAAEAAQEVRDKVAAEVGELPTEAKDPVVEKFDIGGAPVLTLTLSGPMPVEKLTTLAEDVVKPALQREDGVGTVDVIGGRERELRVVVDPERLRAHGLVVSDVGAALKGQSLDAPAGRTLEPGLERAVRLQGEARTVDELRALVVASPGGVPVHVGDVATVVDGPQEERSAATWNGTSTVAFQVRKQTGANTVAVVERLRESLPQLEKRLPQGLSMEVVDDGSTFIHGSIRGVEEDLVLGGIFAVIIVLVFLRNWRSTAIAAVALPTSVIGTIAVMAALGFTFNVITMLALSLSIGLLIDDAIVVIENVVRRLEQGEPPFQAALEGTKQIAVAVLAVTLVIVAVFVPVAFMSGIMGRLFYQFGITVAVAVLISYAVSMTVTPMMAARMLREHHGQPSLISRAIERALLGLESGYERLLQVLLRHRWKTVAAAVGVFALTVALVPLMKATFIPATDQGVVEVAVKLPVGATIDRTKRQLADLEQQVRTMPGVESVYTAAGGGTQEKVNEGTLRVNLVPIAERELTQQQLQKRLRTALVVPPGVTLSIQETDPTGNPAKQVQFNLRSDDWDALVGAAAKLEAAMRAKPGFVDVDTSAEGGKPQIDVRLDRDRAASLGVQAGSVASVLRAYLGGDEVTKFREGGESYDVVLALPDALRADPVALAGLQVRSATGELVELGNVARLDATEGPAQIDRQARQRQVTMLANLDGLSLGEATAWLQEFARTELPPTIVAEPDGDAKRLGESGATFGSALLLGVVLIYLILAAQFESLLDPLSVMLALPLALIGAIGSLLLSRTEMSLFGMIGVIMLMGLVAKNGILLVEFARQLKEEGKATYDALVEAGRVRLRPILMTTIAMIAGMVPVALARGDGAEMRVPMAIVIIGGLITSTVLTLGVVPVAYSLLDQLRARLARRRAPRAVEGAPAPEPEAAAAP
jgi:hydrophobic/amphiphilic exporter-1 (mainly G- bacteria), HAE1 family